mmetsp:Transcript_46045/g.114238  ORF Transcript_46045/g.114238 Transcript_46045/m.114238 type:complete len:248 (-) Transcript_46045:742-1485(-)
MDVSPLSAVSSAASARASAAAEGASASSGVIESERASASCSCDSKSESCDSDCGEASRASSREPLLVRLLLPSSLPSLISSTSSRTLAGSPAGAGAASSGHASRRGAEELLSSLCGESYASSAAEGCEPPLRRAPPDVRMGTAAGGSAIGAGMPGDVSREWPGFAGAGAASAARVCWRIDNSTCSASCVTRSSIPEAAPTGAPAPPELRERRIASISMRSSSSDSQPRPSSECEPCHSTFWICGDAA